MVYHIPYEAEFECPVGHKFTAQVNVLNAQSEATCPTCYAEWVDKHIPKGKRVSEPKAVNPVTLTTYD